MPTTLKPIEADLRDELPPFLQHVDIAHQGGYFFKVDGREMFCPDAYNVAHRVAATGHIQPGTYWELVKELTLPKDKDEWLIHTQLSELEAQRLVNLARHMIMRYRRELPPEERASQPFGNPRLCAGFVIADLYGMLEPRAFKSEVIWMTSRLRAPEMSKRVLLLATDYRGLTGSPNCALRQYLDGRMEPRVLLRLLAS